MPAERIVFKDDRPQQQQSLDSHTTEWVFFFGMEKNTDLLWLIRDITTYSVSKPFIQSQ